MRRGSVLGVVDHALDLVLVASRGPEEAAPWVDLGLALLAAPPATPMPSTDWGGARAEKFGDDLQLDQAELFPRWLAALVAQPGFGQAIAQRFTHRELDSFVPTLGKELHETVRRRSEYLLEDLARGIAEGTTFGDPAVAGKLLLSVAKAHGLAEDLLRRRIGTLDS